MTITQLCVSWMWKRDVCLSVTLAHVFGASAVMRGAELAAVNSIDSGSAIARNYGGGR